MALAPLHWSVSAGTLPSGLSIDPVTGTISGTPTRAGTSAFTVKLTDATAPTALVATAALSVTVAPAVQTRVYVANSNNTILGFGLATSGTASPLLTIGGPNSPLEGTTAIALDATGRIYAASAGQPEIVEYAPGVMGNAAASSVIVGPDTGLVYPTAVAIDGSGQLWVANHSANSITVYAPGASGDAVPVRTIMGPSTGLDGPSAIAFDGHGLVWVGNTGNSTLTAYPVTASGDVPWQQELAGPHTGLDLPQGIAIDAQGNLLVANLFGHSLTEYPDPASGDVTPLRTITGTLTGLSLPDGVDVDTQGNIYVSDEFGIVSRFAPNASGNVAPVATIGASLGVVDPNGLAVAPPLAIATAKLRIGRAGHRYRELLVADLGRSPFRWTVVAGHLPHGLHLERDGVLVGSPTRTGVYRFTVRVADSSRPTMTARRRLMLRVVGGRRAGH
jgi:sugar lactone lactonase YvrE